MADLRFDPVSGIWVAVARKRRERPMEFIPMEQLHQQIICPFCGGNEDETPEPILAYADDGSLCSQSSDAPNWISRIIPNKYPSLIQPTKLTESGPYECLVDDGIQDLVIPTPRHVISISDLTEVELEICLLACRKRVQEIREVPEIQHVTLFMNCRSAAGASLEHIHFQVMGSPMVSPYLQLKSDRNADNWRKRGESLITSLLKWEMSEQRRVLSETENFVMFCPYASRFAFQVWIVPKNPHLPFGVDDSINFNAELGRLCKLYVERLESLIENAAYNVVVNLNPTKESKTEHWYVEIFPRLNRMAGYEIGTDIWVNPVPPETACKRLSIDK